MEYCELGLKIGMGDPVYRRFYVAIAAVLCDQWDRYAASVHARGVYRAPTGAEQFRRHGKGRGDCAEEATAETGDAPRAAFLPIAATTNYDGGLELVFGEFKIPYHVLFPIQPIHEGAVAQWVLRSVVPDEIDYDLEMSSRDEELPKGAKLSGPVIVKLHGAPTLRKHMDRHGGQVKHRIVASETDYLVAMQEGSSVLKWFETEMFNPLGDHRYDPASQARTTWFLGYSIADLNIRLLYSNLRRTSRYEHRLRAVNIDNNPFRQSFLKDLRVELCHGELSKVSQIICYYYNGRYKTSTSAVRMLVDELRRLG